VLGGVVSPSRIYYTPQVTSNAAKLYIKLQHENQLRLDLQLLPLMLRSLLRGSLLSSLTLVAGLPLEGITIRSTLPLDPSEFGFFNSWQAVTRFDLRSDLGVDSGVGHPLVVVLPFETNGLAPFLLLS